MDSKGDKLLPIRLSPEADVLLRPAGAKRGELARRVIEAVSSVDLSHVPVEDRPRTPNQGKSYATTTVNIPKKLHLKLTKAAEKRDTSVSALIDGAVKAHFGSESGDAETGEGDN